MSKWEEWKKHPKWEKANQACKHATGVGLEDAWYNNRGCYSGRHWVSPEVIAEAIAALMFGYEAWEEEW